ncbi:NADPH-dependent FMN reductase [Nocardiopsis changdeensis]|uniref:NADPH-dependent FMN reductase n=1 Tax=Nocardiopsis changdeensis TaxID=2831969 RepID=UPI003F487E96
MPRLMVLSASTRPTSPGPSIASWVTGRAVREGVFTPFTVDLAELALPFLDEPGSPSQDAPVHPHTRAWSATVASADAFVFVVNEYNHSYTAPLKNAVDFLFHEWRRKPVGFVGYGMSSRGMRAVEAFQPVAAALGMVPAAPVVTVGLRDDLDGAGVFRPGAALDSAADAMLRELGGLERALSGLRASGAA